MKIVEKGGKEQPIPKVQAREAKFEIDRFKVSAKSLIHDPQDFALVVTGELASGLIQG